MKMSVWSLACQQRVFQWYHSENISKSFTQTWRRKPAGMEITSLSLYVLPQTVCTVSWSMYTRIQLSLEES